MQKNQIKLWTLWRIEEAILLVQCRLGYCYQKGLCDVKQDLEKAVEWYRKAAEQGYALAQCNLGYCYEKGEGEAKEHTQAAK